METLVPTQEITKYKEALASAEKFSLGLTITNDDEYKAALAEGTAIKTQLTAIVARKEIITKPLNASLKSVRELFKPLEAAGESALATIKGKMLNYTREKERKEEETKQKLAQRVERGTMKPETLVKKLENMPTAAPTVQTEEGKATTKTVQKWRVIDKSKIPVEFMEPNMVAIKAAFKAGNPVPGVEQYEEKELSLG